jgi:hypothetical protein
MDEHFIERITWEEVGEGVAGEPTRPEAATCDSSVEAPVPRIVQVARAMSGRAG